MKHIALALLILTGCALLGCKETDKNTDVSSPDVADTSPWKPPSILPEDSEPGFRRLTYEQFNRTLSDLHGGIWKAAWEKGDFKESWLLDEETLYFQLTRLSDPVWAYYRRLYPKDVHTAAGGEPRGGYRRLDSIIYNEHVAMWMYAAVTLADSLYEKWVGTHIILQPCVAKIIAETGNTDSTDAIYSQCMSTFIHDFGRRAFRRPLTDEEHDGFLAIYENVVDEYAQEGLSLESPTNRGLRNVITVITQSPEFLYRVELGDDNGTLTAYELASRLSYHFWDTMPDDALFEAAADGSLMTEAGYQAQVERLFNDPKSKRTIDAFYRDYFRVQDIPDIGASDRYNKYHAFPYDTYGDTLSHTREALEDELANVGMWFTASHPGTYEDLFRSNLHFLACQSPDDATDQCYGAGPYSHWSYGIPGTCTADDCQGLGWDGTSEPISLPEPERVGLLTRLGLLAHDTYAARPIRRGLHIREALLCEAIPPPENCDVVKPPEVDGDNQVLMTVREKVEAITEQPGTSCAGCHTTFINGFGYALGHFSSKGQYWEKEHMFATEKGGRFGDGEYPFDLADESLWTTVDATGTTVLNGETIAFDGAHELADRLVDSGRLEWCWAREYFRYALGRAEADDDLQTIDALAQTMRDGATLAEAYKAIAHVPAFKTLLKATASEEQP